MSRQRAIRTGDADRPSDEPESIRTRHARERLAQAQSELDTALAERHERGVRAEPVRRRRALVLTLGSLVVAIVAVVVAALLGAAAATDSDRRAATTDAVAAAREAVTQVLTVDPGRPRQYLDTVRRVSSGDFRRRIDAAGPAIEAAVAALGAPSAGRVIAGGAESDVRRTGSDTEAVTVYVVADGGADVLFGTDAARLRLSIRMVLSDDSSGRWTMDSVRR